MLRNYIKVAFRHLIKQRGYTALNIIGLTIGITSSLLILLYIFNELSFDKHHSNSNRIYRISSEITEPDNSFKWAVTQMPLAYTLKNTYAEVEEYSRFVGNGRTRLELDNINYFEQNIYFVDSAIFKMFDFNWIAGDQKTALLAPNSIALNKTIADKIFKGEDPIGKSLKTDGDQTWKVTGVYEDMAQNSHIIAEALISMATLPTANTSSNWGSFGIYTYVMLNEANDAKSFAIKLPEIIKEYVAPVFDQFEITVVYELLPITTIHLYSDYEGEPEALGDINYIYIFSAVGLFLLLIACINYMNLSTARSTKRSLEVGIRKVMGAQRPRLIGQFLSESILITIASFILSLSILFIIIPFLNNTLGTNLLMESLLQKEVVLAIILIITITGILGGSYPAFYLSSFRPVVVLKGTLSNKGGNKLLRKVLVTVQFSISIFMLIGTGIIYNQMNFVQSKNLGFDKENVIRFNLPNGQARAKWPVLRSKLLDNSNIINASTSASTPGNGFGKNLMNIESEEGVMEQKGLDHYGIDYDYFPTLKIEIVEGRNFSLDYGSDSSSAIMVNEAMVKRMGWSNPIGKKVQFGTQDTLAFSHVVGVVKNFHQQSLYNPIEALMFHPNTNNRRALVKIGGNTKSSLKSIETTWQEVFPTIPFEYEFIDESFLEQYETDQLRGKLFLGFSIMTIVISCLGLLGLASYTAEQRTKEISIRKVLGAETGGLVSLIIKDFIYLVIIGALPAFILSWYSMNEWLSSFEYHISIGPMIFILVFIITLGITILTTGFFALKAANSNPAENLKYE